MRILHLSDIHFREPDCLEPATDTDRPYRAVLEQDIVEMCRDGRHVGAILVGGDIAYKAHPDEYEAAREWLVSLAEKCHCPQERIYVVPGNHDVDQSVCKKALSVSTAQEAIVRAHDAGRARVLREHLRDKEVGRSLFLPLDAYNDFAASFNCNVYPSKPFWSDTVDLAAGLKLRLFGLTSTLLSGLGNRDDEPGHLYLSPLQTVFDKDADVVHLVICHHPPHWFVDGTQVDDDVNGRTKLQFFGHEHTQRCTRDPSYTRFKAGAVNPDKREPGWRPGYNVVDLDVIDAGAARKLRVRAQVRQWQNAPEMFIPVMESPGISDWMNTMSVPEHLPLGDQLPVAAVAEPRIRHSPLADAARETADLAANAAAKLEATMSTPSTRNLIYRFWNHLDVSDRRDIALKLGLITQDELKAKVPDSERYGKALERAGSRGLLIDLAREVEAIEQKQ
jgi:hypothetical protein